MEEILETMQQRCCWLISMPLLISRKESEVWRKIPAKITDKFTLINTMIMILMIIMEIINRTSIQDDKSVLRCTGICYHCYLFLRFNANEILQNSKSLKMQLSFLQCFFNAFLKKDMYSALLTFAVSALNVIIARK